MSTLKPTPHVDVNTEKNTSHDIDTLLRDSFTQCTAPQDVCEATIEHIHSMQMSTFMDQTQKSSILARRAKIKGMPFARIAAVAAVVLLAGMCLVGYSTWNHVVAIVSIDVNPSLELSLNRYERVVDVRAVNDDAMAIVERADVKGMTCEDAVSEILADEGIEQGVEKGIAEGYTEEQSAVAITVIPMHPSEHYGQACSKSAQRAIDQAAYPCQLSEGSNEEYEAATALGMGVGKYRMYIKLQPEYPELTPEDVAHMPMCELRALAGEGCGGLGYCGNDSGYAVSGGKNGCAAGEDDLEQNHSACERSRSCNGKEQQRHFGCNEK